MIMQCAVMSDVQGHQQNVVFQGVADHAASTGGWTSHYLFMRYVDIMESSRCVAMTCCVLMP
jgi:hypothetical protein